MRGLEYPLLLSLLIALSVPSCGRRVDRHFVEETMEGYIRAVQERETDALFDLTCDSTAKLKENPEDEFMLRYEFERTFDYIYGRYLRQREKGFIEFDADGLALIKASALGRGVFYERVGFKRLKGGRAVLVMKLIFAYEKINYEDLPAGTAVYFMGYPVGTIHKLTVGEREFGPRLQLDTLQARWWFERRDPSDGESRWCVEKVESLPDPAIYHEALWHLDAGRAIKR